MLLFMAIRYTLKRILYILVLMTVLSFDFRSELTVFQLIIVNNYPQCKDCSVEIGRYLNKTGIEPIMLYRGDKSPLVNLKLREEFNQTYQSKFNFAEKQVLELPEIVWTENRFPVLLKVIELDTFLLTYDYMFAGKKSKLNKKNIGKFVKY